MVYKVISFYRYVEISDPSGFRDAIRSFCKSHDIFGRILIGEEGINASCSGTLENINLFKDFLESGALFAGLFSGLTYREQDFESGHSYHKLVVRVRNEICAFGESVDLANKADYIEPSELESWYKENKDFIIIDVRNTYEYDVGHFKNATKVPTRVFSEFPAQVTKQLASSKDKDIVLYCTGGIRCEKASAYLKEQGFSKVRHIKGGIINYVNQFPDSKWEGGLFVFDDRKVSDVGKAVSGCLHCDTLTNGMINCYNLDCDRLFLCCSKCSSQFNHSCSSECKVASRRRESDYPLKNKKVISESKVIGEVSNYYSKANVMLVKLGDSGLSVGDSIIVNGVTTNGVSLVIGSMRDYDGKEIQKASAGEEVTIVVSDRVRVHDKVMIA